MGEHRSEMCATFAQCKMQNVQYNCSSSLLLIDSDLGICFFRLQVWRALLKEMPLQAMLRILGKMTADKVLEPGRSETAAICDRIQSETALKKV